MITKEFIENSNPDKLIGSYPFVSAFFENNAIDPAIVPENETLKTFLGGIDEAEREDRAIEPDQIISQLTEYINQMLTFLGRDDDVHSITILPGFDKSGEPEGFDKLEIRKSEIISIVGPTGSGKSRLLADIEWTAQKDTPTSRSIMVNNKAPDRSWRFSSSKKLVAQLSQNMNFVMDLSVEEFLSLHAESRMIENSETLVKKIIDEANLLAGESFTPDTPITGLSGGQSRALMIADTAILSNSPIILIDEIENAGIDRKKALKLLLSEEKIVLMATHDPILALMADKRVVIKNGGISAIIETSAEEKAILEDLEKLDQKLLTYRNKLRQGHSLAD
jgi:ABC-type lipoprotein export system ATPase subunit